MEYFTNHTRITIAGRLQDHYLTAQARTIFEENKLTKGSTFSIIDINCPWFTGAQTGQSIINTLNREYSRASNSSDLVNFELALKKTNEALGKITQNGENEWIGRLDSCLVLICDNQIHLTKTGKAEAYLIRQGKISCITENFNSNPELHPLKTYSDIISGSLEAEDKIVITTPRIFDYFSKDYLKQIVAQHNTYDSAWEIANKLRHENEKKSAVIIIESISKENLANLLTDEKEEVIYLDQNAGISEIITDTRNALANLKPLLSKSQESLGDFFRFCQTNISVFSKQLNPYFNRFFQSTKHYLSDGQRNLQSKIIPIIKAKIKPISEKITPKLGVIVKKAIVKDDKTVDQNLNIHHYTEKIKINKDSPTKRYLMNLWYKFIEAILKSIQWLINPKNRSFLYIILVILLSIILILSINNLRNKQNQKTQEETANQIIIEMKNKLDDDYKLAILYNNKTQAKDILSEVIEKTGSLITENQTIKTSASELFTQAQNELDKLNNVQRIKNLTMLTEFSKTDSFSDTHDYIFALNKDQGKITFSTKINVHKEDIKNPDEAGNIITITPTEEADAIYYLTNQNRLFKITNPLETARELKTKEGDWKNGVSMRVFAENIYVLDSNGNQIWKFNKDSDGFSSAQSFVASSVDINDGVDLAIDGVIYVLKKSGDILKLSKGRQQDFRIKDIPKPDDKITNPLRIYTNADANYLYVLDGNRLLELEKSGTFVAQYIFDGLNNLQDLSINTKTKEILLLDGNKVYKGNL